MGAAIGQSLPVAVGVLVSPLPIVAVVLMLASGRARANAFTFLITWFVAVGAVTLVVALVSGAAAPDAGGPATWVGVVKIVLGLLLLLLAVRQWHGRPRDSAEPPTPKWMTAVDAFTPVKAAGLAALLGAVNPKNLLLAVSGGVAISSATMNAGDQIVAAVVFALIASIGVAVPVAIYVSMGARAAAILEELKTWLIHHNPVIMAVLLLVIGAKMLGDGISVI